MKFTYTQILVGAKVYQEWLSKQGIETELFVSNPVSYSVGEEKIVCSNRVIFVQIDRPGGSTLEIFKFKSGKFSRLETAVFEPEDSQSRLNLFCFGHE